MGFITGAFNKSVFNGSSYRAAIGDNKTNADGSLSKPGYAVVRISPKYARTGRTEKDLSIIGVFNTAEGDYSFNIKSNWTEMGGVVQSTFPGAGQKLIERYQQVAAGASLLGATAQANVFASKKIYQKSDYMTLKVPMMVVDWEGIGQPLMSTMLLAYYCLPDGNITKEIGNKIEQFIDDQIEKMRSSENIGEKIIGNVAGATKKFSEGAIIEGKQHIREFADKHGGQYALGNLTEDLDTIATLRSSPVPVIVEIGNFFKHQDMVIEDLSYTFSKEMTRQGPLFVKINLELSTRKILSDIEDVGLTIPVDGRYRIIDPTIAGINLI